MILGNFILISCVLSQGLCCNPKAKTSEEAHATVTTQPEVTMQVQVTTEPQVTATPTEELKKSSKKCRLNSRDHFGEPLPIVIKDSNLLEPTDAFGNIEMNYGDVITLSCSEKGSIMYLLTQQNLNTAHVRCEEGTYFRNDEWLSAPAAFHHFRCGDSPNHSSRRTDRKCYGNNAVFEVGYIVENEFYPVYETCFDEHALNPIYSKYTQKPYNAYYQTRVVRPFFISEGTYGYNVPVEMLFTPRGLRSAVAQTVGNMIDKYFTGTQMLSRGHLAAKTDFVYAFGERATFHYLNCAPQWTGFNGGNWNTLEVDLRNHVHSARYNTIVYTGTFGVTQLFNQFGRLVDIYLYNDINNNPVIPVPEYYYKVVYEPSTKCGIAFVGINNPYYSENRARELFFCNDICRRNSNFSWLSWHPDNRQEGYTFCCTVPEFRLSIRHLPDFEVNCLLT